MSLNTYIRIDLRNQLSLLLSIHAYFTRLCKQTNTSIMPISYTLSRSLNLRTVRDCVLSMGRNWNVQSITMDFESAMWQACRSVFPSASLHGCFFHWSQAIWRKVQDLGLQSAYRNDPIVRDSVRHLLGLPFLPYWFIPRTFRFLSNLANTGELARLFRYVNETWVEGNEWRPQHWSVFDRDIRTNNDLEGWHHRLNNRAQKSNLRFYALVKLLLEESELVSIYDRLIATGRYPVRRHRRRRYVQMNARIRRYWRAFAEGLLSPVELLRKCAGLYGHIRRR